MSLLPPQSTESARADSRALAFFDEVHDAFHSATQATGIVERFYAVSGRRLQLRFAGDALVSTITPALAHLAAEPGPVSDVVVCLWDSASTGCRMPPAPWRDTYAMRGEIEGFNTERLYTVCERGYPSITMFDGARGLALYWVPDVGSLPDWVKGAPLRLIFHWWMGFHGRQLVHGAAVGHANGGVLITARGGSGKSTSALACLHAGMSYAGDDYVVITLEPSPYVSNLYRTAKIAAGQTKAFPWLAGMIANPDRLHREKALVFLDGRYAQQLSAGFPLRAVLVPHVSGRRDTELKEASPAAALAALAPSTILLHPRGGDDELKRLGRLVRALPCYTLECGTDLTQIPQVIAALLG